jgi:uncharacterized membrane protein YgdD (TMEM256/DUF423 family)
VRWTDWVWGLVLVVGFVLFAAALVWVVSSLPFWTVLLIPTGFVWFLAAWFVSAYRREVGGWD